MRRNRTESWIVLVLATTISGLMGVPLVGQEWPQWRGPNRDGITPSFKEPQAWPDKLVERWKVEVGTGYSTPILSGDRLYVFSREGEEEVMRALDPASGKVIWRTAYPTAFKMNPATKRHGPGPKSTPTLAGGRLFTLGITGIVSAFDAKSGKLLWQKPAPPVEPLYHTGMSPLVDGNLVILHVGGHDAGALTAFDATTGDVRWSWTGDGPAYGSPLVFDLGGTRQVVTFTQKFFVGVALETGKLLWQRPYTTPSNTTSQTPMLYKDMIIESGRNNGFTAFRVVRDGENWTTKDVWKTADVSVHMSDCVILDNVLFGLSHLNRGEYFALDLDTGKVLWKSEPRQTEHAALVRSGKTIFSLEEDGELVVLRASLSGFEPLKRYTVATSETWSQPTISGNRIFVRDVSSVVLWTLN
jgi:outer membrane protein assembly factor BamB